MQVARARAARSLQTSVGVSGASLAVDAEGRLYTVFISPRTVYLPFQYVPLQNSLPLLGELQQRSCSYYLLDTMLAQVSFDILTLWSFFNQHLDQSASSDHSDAFLLRAILPLVNGKNSPESSVDITNSSGPVG